MKVRKAWVAGGLITFVGVMLLAAWYRGWFSDEPTYRGKTVTQWMDSMALFDQQRNADATGQRSFQFPNSPVGVANDPALRALLRIGSNAVPVLVKRLTEPPQWSGPTARFKAWAEWRWNQLRNPRSTTPRPTPAYRGSFQRAREQASALALLAFGTNANAGVPRLLEIWTSGTNRDILSPTFTAFNLAAYGLPNRREEMIAGLGAAIRHTNPVMQREAIMLTQSFRGESALWKATLLKMTEDPDVAVKRTALWSLAVENRDDPDVLRLLESTLEDISNPTQLREIAASGLAMAGVKATNFLPLLRVTLNDSDKRLQAAARTAIATIEHAVPDDKARTSE